MADDESQTRDPDDDDEMAAAGGAPGRRRGCFGTVLMLVGLLAVLGGGAWLTRPLWIPHVVPLLPEGVAVPAWVEAPFRDPRVGALDARLKALETRPDPAAATDPALEQMEGERSRFSHQLGALMARVDSLEQALGSVKTMIKATGALPADDPRAGRDDLSGRLAHLEAGDKAVRALAERIERLERLRNPLAADDPGQAERVARIAARLDALERTESLGAEAVLGGRATVLAVGQLREALRRSGSFADALAGLGAVAGDEPEIARAVAILAPYAETGIPTLPDLRRRFDDMARAVLAADPAVAGDGWVERTASRLASLVTIRRSAADPDDTSAGALLARAEAGLGAGDLVSALTILDGLRGPAAAAAAPWVSDARTRLEAEQALAALSIHAVSLLKPEREAPAAAPAAEQGAGAGAAAGSGGE